MAAAVFAIAAFASTGSATDASSLPPPDPTSSLQVAQQLADAQHAEANHEAFLASPGAAAARTASRTAYRGQTAGQAVATDERAFGDQVGAEAFNTFGKSGLNAQLVRRLSDRMAVVQDEHGHQSVAVGALPLFGERPDGQQAPIDLGLSDGGGSFLPASTLVPVELPKRSDGEVAFPKDNFKVQFMSGTAVDAVRAGGALVFPDAGGEASDTDAVLRALPAGAEISFLLRSPSSPESESLSFDLPAGWQLKNPDGSVGLPGAIEVVDQSGKTIATVLPPQAVDSQGQRVPVRYALQDATHLAVDVKHRSGSYDYPILVDPAIEDWWTNSQVLGGWFTYANQSGIYPGPASSGGNTNPAVYGLPNDAYSGGYGEYYYVAPSGAYIEGFDDYDIYHWPNNSDEFGGIYSYANGNWEPGSWSQATGQSGTPAYRPWASSEWDQAWESYSASQPAPPNAAAFGLLLPGTTANNGAYPTMLVGGNAVLAESDDQPVSLGAVSHSGYTPGRWVSDVTDTVTATASVPSGLGIFQTSVNVPSPNGTVDYNNNCTGSHLNPCSLTQNASITYDTTSLPEGTNTVCAQAESIAFNQSAQQCWPVNIDRTDPSVQLSGSAWTNPVQTNGSGTLPLNVTATDPSPDGPSVQTSGITSITTTVNGSSYAAGPNAQQSCPNGGCGLSANGNINLADLHSGDNDIEVDVTDTAGNTAPVEWSIMLPGEDSDIQATASAAMQQDLGISASDANSRLALQDAAAPILDNIDTAVGTSASGDQWFDNSTGRLEIGVVSSTSPPTGPNVDAAKQILSQAGLLGSADFVQVAYSEADLEAAQSQLDQQLSSLESQGRVATAIDPSANQVVLDEANNLTPKESAQVQQAVGNLSAPSGQSAQSGQPAVAISTDSASNLGASVARCGFHTIPASGKGNWVTCDPAFRGGTAIDDYGNVGCTTGFPAVGTGAKEVPNNTRVLLTAGHCFYYSILAQITKTLPDWESFDSRGRGHKIYRTNSPYDYAFTGLGDYGYMTMTDGSYWQPRSQIYAGGGDPVYDITSDGRVAQGDYLCSASAIPISSPQSGFGIPDVQANRHIACGRVLHTSVRACYRIVSVCVNGLVETDITATVQGGSGGPVYKNHRGYGLVSGTLGNHHMVYQNIHSVENAFGVIIYGF